MSIGIGDVTPFSQLLETKDELLKKGYESCDKLIEDFKENRLVLKAGCNAE